MARPKSTGVNRVVRKRADGSISKVDYYHRASGLHLGTDEEAALDKAREMDDELPRSAAPVALFEGLVADYLASRHFRRLEGSSQKVNRHYVRLLERDFAGIRVDGISKAVLEAYAERLDRQIYAAPERTGPKPRLLKGDEGPMSPTKARHLLNKLSILMSHATRLTLIPTNPCLNLRIGFGVTPREEVWENKEIRAFLKQAKGPMRLAGALLLYTAQRLADVLAMTWEQVDTKEDGRTWATVRYYEEDSAGGKGREWARLRQQKTGALVSFPVHRDLRTILDEVPVAERHGPIVKSPRKGEIWSGRNFARSWDACEAAAGLADSGKQRRDLRRTAMCLMSIAGATDQQVAAVSGHSIEQTRQILATYIPRLGAIAAGGIAAWEKMPSILEEPSDGALQKPLHNSGDMQHAAE